MKKTIAVLLMVCMIAAVFAGCAQQTPETSASAPIAETANASEGVEENAGGSEASGDNVLKLAWTQGIGTDTMFESPYHDIKSLYPNMLFSTLIKISGEDGSYVNDLAEEYTVSDDGLVYTFKLRNDAQFSDGTPVTAEDVVFSLNAMAAFEKAGFKQFYVSIKGMSAMADGSATELEGAKALDENTVEITLDKPDNTVLYGLAHLCIIPKAQFEGVELNEVATYETFWTKPIGSGPYVIAEVSFPNYFTMVRNENYYGNPAGIENVLFTSYDTGGNEAVTAAAIAGELDFIFGDAVNDINTMTNITTQNPDMTSAIVPSSYTRQLRFNLGTSEDGKHNDAVNDPKVREAFNLLIDKATLAAFYGEQAVPATTMVNPDDPLYNTEIPAHTRDVERAKQLLDEAGFDYSKSIRLLYYYDDQTTADMMEVIKQNFAEAGVTVEPFLATGDLNTIIYSQKNWDMQYCAGGSTGQPIIGYAYLVPDGANWDMLYGNVEEREATYGKYYADYLAATDDAARKAAGDALQLQEVTDNYDICIYNLNKMVGYNSAHLQFDTSILNGDYQQAKDYKFDTWKLVG